MSVSSHRVLIWLVYSYSYQWCYAVGVLAIHGCCPTPTCQRRSHARKGRGGGGEEDDGRGQGEVVDEGVGGGGGVCEEVARVRVVDTVERHFDGHDGALRGKGGAR